VSAGQAQCDGTVEVIEYLGADTFILFDCGELGRMSVRVPGESELNPGDVKGLAFDAGQIHFFDVNGVVVSSN